MLDLPTHSISERRVSRFSPSEPSSSANPVCTKHPRQSPLCMRTTPQQCGHSSYSCWCVAKESVRPEKSMLGEVKLKELRKGDLASVKRARREIEAQHRAQSILRKLAGKVPKKLQNPKLSRLHIVVLLTIRSR